MAMRFRARDLLAFLAAAALGAALGCAKKVDPDAEPSGATPLPLETWKADSLNCKDGDCADWYRFEAPDPGRVSVEVVAVSKDAKPTPPYSVVITDGGATKFGEAKSGAAPITGLEARVDKPGVYFLEIAEPPDTGALGYELRVNFQADAPPPLPPPPPKKKEHRAAAKPAEPAAAPRAQKLTGTVIETEGATGKVEAVLIDLGTPRGVKPGMRGRLVDHGRQIASIEIIEVYRSGSRARIDGYLSGSIGPATAVEIEVPTGTGQ
ncbi:MAG TPA: hypothetical protein DEP35_19005 [Deltaproteobacteria bacterium]|jgi:hypothetical protein|nr:hypothetical protein [Deltaproteobacteria bacterium]